MLSYILAGVVGYLFGSFPTAYLIVKWKSRIDIRLAGSGNVGMLNSYQVTQSKLVAVFVLLIDLCKGVVAVLTVRETIDPGFVLQAIAGVTAVVGHNFPIWLKFKGGRGLATAAGVMLMLGWIILPIWMLVWFLGNRVSKDVNIGNAFATVIVVLMVVIAPASVLFQVIPKNAQENEFALFVSAVGIVILSRLVRPVLEYFSKQNAYEP